MATLPLLLAYDGCGTCKKAYRWLADHGVAYTKRPIVEQPPTPAELLGWVAAAGLPLRKWLNTSGQSYRDRGGKAVFDAASDTEILAWLAADGKLVKRPVLVDRGGRAVLVGFDPEGYTAHFARR